MKPEEVRTPADAKKIVDERGLKHVKVGLFDMDGILRGKYMAREKFVSALEGGFGMCDVVLGWDSNDVLYDNVTFTGWHTAFPDAPARIIPETCRELPFENNTLFFLCEFTPPADLIDPRGVLSRMVERARSMGFEPYCSCEYEFFMFEETPDSVREKGYRNLKPLTPGNFGYSVIRASVWSEFYHEVMDSFEQMRIPIEGLHTETGPGVLEAAIGYSTALEAADRGALFKTAGALLGLAVAMGIHYSSAQGQQSAVGAVLLNMAVFGAVVSYLLQMACYILLKVRMPHIRRPYLSPFGIPGAIFTGLMTMLTLVTLFIINEEYVNVVIGALIWFALGIAYFAVIGRKNLVRSPEEEFALVELEKGRQYRESQK